MPHLIKQFDIEAGSDEQIKLEELFEPIEFQTVTMGIHFTYTKGYSGSWDEPSEGDELNIDKVEILLLDTLEVPEEKHKEVKAIFNNEVWDEKRAVACFEEVDEIDKANQEDKAEAKYSSLDPFI
jgi:spore coat polysaccharide biosynthesis predicted glycosyltransferase SpsG